MAILPSSNDGAPGTPSRLIRQLEHNFARCCGLFKGFGRVRYRSSNESIYFMTGCVANWMNGVIWCDFPDGKLSQQVDAVLEDFRVNGSPGVWRIGPLTGNSSALTKCLESKGCSYLSESPGMARSAEGLPPLPDTNLQVKRVETEAQLEEWLLPFCYSFGVPAEDRAFWLDFLRPSALDPSNSYQHYVGYRGGKPITTGSILHDGDFAVIYAISTLQPYRKLGYGTAMTLYCAYLAKQQGAKDLGLYASYLGAPMYRKLGFQDVLNTVTYSMV